MKRLAGWTSGAVLALGAAVAASQSPVFKARVEGVRIDVLVTEGGRPLAGLRADDFDVRDNGVPQTVDLVSLGDVPVNVVLAFDVSASVSGHKLLGLTDAGSALLDALDASDSAALVTFNRWVVHQVPLTRTHFDRWLAIWHATVDHLVDGEVADAAKVRASKVADAFHGRLAQPDLVPVCAYRYAGPADSATGSPAG